jgi:hypothetical protein
MLRGQYLLPVTLPSRVYDLLKRLDKRDGPSASKESDYRGKAAETMRLAQRASSSAVKARLGNLAAAWIALAEKARKASSQFRS